MNELCEELADLCHQQWSGWMAYLFSKCLTGSVAIGQAQMDPDNAVLIPREYVERWVRQMETAYEDLPEQEKDSDRKEADRFLAVIQPPDREGR